MNMNLFHEKKKMLIQGLYFMWKKIRCGIISRYRKRQNNDSELLQILKNIAQNHEKQNEEFRQEIREYAKMISRWASKDSKEQKKIYNKIIKKYLRE